MAKRGLIENKERRERKKRENQTRPPDTVYDHCQLMSSASSLCECDVTTAVTVIHYNISKTKLNWQKT